MRKIVLILAIVFSSMCYSQNKEVFFADPTIYVSNGRYYMTGTRNLEPLGFSLLVSDDLTTWECIKTDNSDLVLKSGTHVFGNSNFWAPQIFKEKNKYLMAYTANEHTALAESKHLSGPYLQTEISPIDNSEKNIDPFIFKDDNGKYYLYHVRFDKGNYIWVAEFDMEKKSIVPGTLFRCFKNTQDWERTSNYVASPIMEGPTVIKKGDWYYMFYSANHFKNIDYAVGYAIAPTPYGPWKKAANNPIIHRSIIGENGSGHGDVFKGKDGNFYYVFHVHHSDKEAQPRRTRIVPLKFEYIEENGQYKISVDKDNIIIPKYK